ncbi:hypothetical protein Droror1_Dr00003820 [Drosera rotundifolia]
MWREMSEVSGFPRCRVWLWGEVWVWARLRLEIEDWVLRGGIVKKNGAQKEKKTNRTALGGIVKKNGAEKEKKTNRTTLGGIVKKNGAEKEKKTNRTALGEIGNLERESSRSFGAQLM